MSIYRYFNKANLDDLLPDPKGSLAKQVASSSIVSANVIVKNILRDSDQSTGGIVSPQTSKKRESYAKYTVEQKAEIAKRASEHGIASTIRHFSKKYPNLKESSIRTWKKSYTAEIKRKRNAGEDNVCVNAIAEKKRGRPYLLGEDLDMQVRAYLVALRDNGAVGNSAVAIGCAEGIVKSVDSNLLSSNGGHITLTKHWAKHLLTRMGFVKRRASTKSKISVTNFEEVKTQYLLDIKSVVEMEEIPSDLVIQFVFTQINGG